MADKPGYRYADLVSAGSALLLLVTMFLSAWYGVDGIPGRTSRLVYAENAWEGLTVVRWLIVLTIVTAVGSALLHLSQRSHGARTETGVVVTALGLLTAATLIYRVLISLPAPDRVVDQKLGGFLGVLCALGVAYGGLEALRGERAERLGLRSERTHRTEPTDRTERTERTAAGPSEPSGPTGPGRPTSPRPVRVARSRPKLGSTCSTAPRFSTSPAWPASN